MTSLQNPYAKVVCVIGIVATVMTIHGCGKAPEKTGTPPSSTPSASSADAKNVSNQAEAPEQQAMSEIVVSDLLTPRKEKWTAIRITSIEIGVATNNNGVIRSQPDGKAIFPATIIYDYATRDWRRTNTAAGTIRAKYIFLKLDKEWACALVKAQDAGSIPLATFDLESSRGERTAFSEAYLKQLVSFENATTTDLERRREALLEMGTEFLKLGQAANDTVGIKMATELYTAYRFQLGRIISIYRDHVADDKLKPEEKKDLGDRLEKLRLFANGDLIQKTIDIWEGMKR